MSGIETMKAPVVGGSPGPLSILATAASTAEMPIGDNSTGGALYEFVAAGYAHVAFGLTGLAAADASSRLITDKPVRFFIDPAKVSHIRAIRSGAADVVVSFQRVR